MTKNLVSPEIRDWLMESDPAVRWRVLRYVDGAPEQRWRAERELMVREGWGAALLAERDPDGLWGGGVYSPKWRSAHYTLLLLARLGLPGNVDACQESCALLAERGIGPDGGINYWANRSIGEVCVTGMSLFMFTSFGLDRSLLDRMVDYLLEHRMADGGWNCDDDRGAVHASFHTTMSVLEGLNAYLSAFTGRTEIREYLDGGVEFLMEHRIYRSHRTGETVHPKMELMAYPPRWKHDFMRFFDYCADAGLTYDLRMEDGLLLLERKRGKDGTWRMQGRHTGPVFFDLEPYGKPSRINTLRAVRVLNHFGRRAE